MIQNKESHMPVPDVLSISNTRKQTSSPKEWSPKLSLGDYGRGLIQIFSSLAKIEGILLPEEEKTKERICSAAASYQYKLDESLIIPLFRAYCWI